VLLIVTQPINKVSSPGIEFKDTPCHPTVSANVSFDSSVKVHMAAACDVWLFARIIVLPLVGRLSKGSYPLCHWGVLVTWLSEAEFVAYLENNARAKALELGTMYQLSRTTENQNTVRISSPFLLSELREEWSRPSWTRMGRTDMSQLRISEIGLRLI
jgi:hypothetical protein